MNTFDFYFIQYLCDRVTPFNKAKKGEGWHHGADKLFGGHTHYGRYNSYPKYYFKAFCGSFDLDGEKADAEADRLNKLYGTAKDPKPFVSLYHISD